MKVESNSSAFKWCLQARIQRWLTGLPPPPEKSTQKFLGLPFCGNVELEHMQLKNVLSSLMTILIHAILAGFSVKMILIAQTVIDFHDFY